MPQIINVKYQGKNYRYADQKRRNVSGRVSLSESGSSYKNKRRKSHKSHRLYEDWKSRGKVRKTRIADKKIEEEDEEENFFEYV